MLNCTVRSKSSLRPSSIGPETSKTSPGRAFSRAPRTARSVRASYKRGHRTSVAATRKESAHRESTGPAPPDRVRRSRTSATRSCPDPHGQSRTAGRQAAGSLLDPPRPKAVRSLVTTARSDSPTPSDHRPAVRRWPPSAVLNVRGSVHRSTGPVPAETMACIGAFSIMRSIPGSHMPHLQSGGPTPHWQRRANGFQSALPGPCKEMEQIPVWRVGGMSEQSNVFICRKVTMRVAT